jgi:hypothetical protein
LAQIPVSASGTARDKDNKSFVNSPTRGPNYSAQETFVGNQLDSPIPVFQTFGTIKKLFNESITDPDVDVIVLSYVVTEDALRVLTANISCSIEGKMTFVINGQKIATARTAPAKPDAQIKYEPFLELVSGDVLEVKFKARPNSKVAEVESFINAYEYNF